MPQLFPSSANTVTYAVFGTVLLGTAALIWAAVEITLSPYFTRVNVPIGQPVPFSHMHHVEGLGIDCRYCHTSVEVASSAGIPSTETCMTCHSQVWKDAPVLQPVRDSFMTGKALEWRRVHNLPGFVYFDHSIHVKKGVSCMDCHGRIDEMPLVSKQHTLFMKWCLDCHRHPESALVPPAAVFQMPAPPPREARSISRWMAEQNPRTRTIITDCTACHR
ncbi:MAG TPA: cytochrome c3 family protein [Chthoniobacterales bacterium]